MSAVWNLLSECLKRFSDKTREADRIHLEKLESHLSVLFTRIRFFNTQIRDAFYDEFEPEWSIITNSPMPKEQLLDLVTQIASTPVLI